MTDKPLDPSPLPARLEDGTESRQQLIDGRGEHGSVDALLEGMRGVNAALDRLFPMERRQAPIVGGKGQ